MAATGYMRIKRQKLLFTFYLVPPIKDRDIARRHYVDVIHGNLYLALGVHYIMFRLEKELGGGAMMDKYLLDIWDRIISMEKCSASYNPSYDRIQEGIIDFRVYIGADEWNHYELVMAMDWYYNPVDAV
jgi:hypothetical protein